MIYPLLSLFPPLQSVDDYDSLGPCVIMASPGMMQVCKHHIPILVWEGGLLSLKTTIPSRFALSWWVSWEDSKEECLVADLKKVYSYPLTKLPWIWLCYWSWSKPLSPTLPSQRYRRMKCAHLIHSVCAHSLFTPSLVIHPALCCSIFIATLATSLKTPLLFPLHCF